MIFLCLFFGNSNLTDALTHKLLFLFRRQTKMFLKERQIMKNKKQNE